MSAAFDLLALAARHGIELVPIGGRIRLRAPKAPPPEVLAELRSHNPELIVALNARKASRGGDEYAERAAIVEGGRIAPLEWCEGYKRLCIMPPPADVPVMRWRMFADDAGRFLDTWAHRAAELGWGSFDLVGCNRTKPFARIDRQGLLWLINGRELAAMTADTAAITTSNSGGLPYYRRRDRAPGDALAWELA